MAAAVECKSRSLAWGTSSVSVGRGLPVYNLIRGRVPARANVVARLRQWLFAEDRRSEEGSKRGLKGQRWGLSRAPIRFRFPRPWRSFVGGSIRRDRFRANRLCTGPMPKPLGVPFFQPAGSSTPGVLGQTGAHIDP